MALNDSFKQFILDQLNQLGQYDSKNMFGGTALLVNGKAFAKIKHDKLWLKVNDSNRQQFEERGMQQYSYGKNNSRKINFYETPIEIIENRDELEHWARQSIEVVLGN